MLVRPYPMPLDDLKNAKPSARPAMAFDPTQFEMDPPFQVPSYYYYYYYSFILFLRSSNHTWVELMVQPFQRSHLQAPAPSSLRMPLLHPT